MATVGGVQFLITANSIDYQRKMAAANATLQKLGLTARTVSKSTAAIGPAAAASSTQAITGFTRLEKAVKRVRTVMVSVGVSLATIAGLAAMGKLISAAVEFETAFAGVQKTVDATVPELEQLRNEIRQMAKEIPLTTTELSKIGEVGGQLGIGVQNMGRFIEIIAKLGVATTMTIDDAAMSMARFAAIMRTSEEDYERLASTLVHLGNNFAATEQEIMTMSLRIAGAGKQVGMTEDQVLSLATALTAVGIRAEAGGTAISRTMIEIDKQVAIAGDRLSQFAEVAGLGVTQFAQLWKTDAMAALQLFIEGLSRLEKRGGNASIVLQELGLGAVRVSDTLRRASSAHELLNKTLKFGAEGWRENIALQREADIRFQTTASQFKMLINRVMDLAIAFGEVVLPSLLGFTKALVTVVEAVTSLGFVIDLLIVNSLLGLSKVVLPALMANLTKLAATVLPVTLANLVGVAGGWKLVSGGILLASTRTAQLMVLEKAQILHRTAMAAQITALATQTLAYNTAVTQENLALYGNTAARKSLTVANADLIKANVAVSASTRGVAAATQAATAATYTWSAALKTILPLLIIFITYSVGKYLREQAKALGEWQLAQQKVATQVAELSAKVIKQKEALGGVGDLVKDAGEKYQGASVGMQAFYAASKIPPSYLKDSEEASRQTAEDLEKIKDELEALEKALNSGIGSFENYYKILKAAKDPGRSVKDLIGKMVLSFRDAERAGTSYNTSVGQNIQSIKDLLFWAGYFDVEGDAFAEVLKKWVKEFDLARYAAENLGDILAKLDEDQQKFYLSMNASLHPLKKYSDELAEIKEINKAYGAEIINVTAWLKLNAKSIVDATQKQRELGTVLSKSDLELEALAKTFVGAEGAINKYVDAFKKAINPTVELGKKLKALLDNGEDVNVVVRLYAKEIVEATDTARKWDREINELVGSLEAQARATIPPTHELQKLDFQTISTAESQADFLEIVKRLPPPVEDLAVAINVLGKEFGKAKSPIEALSESLEKNWRQQLGQLTILPEAVAGQIDKMSAAGLNASQIMHLFGGSIKEAAEWLVLLDRPLTEAEQDIVDLAAAATDTSKIIQKQISTIITDLGKGFADIIVEWKGLWTSLKDIAKDFAKGILRIFFESLFTPIMKGFANVMGGVQGGFMGGFQGAGGFGGISGIFKALGGLFTGGGGGGGTAGFGGFTDAAEGMTMMDTAATGTSLSISGLTGAFTELGAGISGAASTMYTFLMTGIAGGPWGMVIAGAAAAAVILWKTVFSKSAYEKFALEFARDFGDIVISDDAIKNFANSLGITEQQLAKVRKDVASSPAFLMIGYNAAVAQGKVDQFLKSLESIETAWGTFDFREAFETGLETGNWLDLNEAFVEAFGTDLLKDIFGEDLKGLLIEIDEETLRLILHTRELTAALETLRDEPVRVAQGLTTMVESIQILRDAGATDAEIMQILGESMHIAVAAANELGIAIPPVIQELLALDIATTGLSESFQKGYAVWGDMIQQGKDLSDMIMGVGARMLDVFAPGTIVAGEAIPSIEGLSTAFKELETAAKTGIGSIPDLMENVRMEAEKLKAIVPDSVGVLIDAFITQAEATAAGGLALQNFETAANSMKGMFGSLADDMIDGLIEQVRYLGTSEQAWLDVGTSLDKLKDKVPEAMHPMIEALRAWAASVHLANVELDGIDAAIQAAFGGDSVDIIRDAAGIAEAQLMTWRILGDDVLTMANNYHILGMELPPVIQLVLDWAIANKHAMESTEGHYIAIGKLSAAYAEGVGIWQNFIDKGWALQDKLMGLGDELLKEYDIVTAQRMAWMFLGDEVISMANAYERAERTLPPVVQMALEYAAAAGLIERNTEGAWVAVEGLTDALEGLNEQQVKGLDAWNDTLTATQDLADFIDGWQMGAITTLGIDVSDAEQVAKLGLLSWNKFGDQIISKANEMIDSGLGEFVDENILKWLDWAKAMGFVTQTADGMWKAIEGPGSDAAKPYWLQNWAAEMDAIYGAEWRNWSQYKNEWGGTSPGTMGGDIPEFPLPDDAIDSFADRVDGIGGISRRSAEDVGRLTEAIDLLGERAGVISRRAFDAGNGINTLDEVIRRTGISARRAAEDIEQARVSLSRFAISRREEAERAVGRRTGDGSSMVSAGNGGSSGNGYIPNDLGWIPPEGWWEGSGLPVAHSGMDYVPQDMVMMLQKGERVVPASENKAGGYKSSGVNVNIVIQGPVYGLDDLDRKIANSVRKTFKAGGLSFLGDS